MPGLKTHTLGTHRTLSPESTFEWVQGTFDRVGITRVADVTWLDEIGIPVYQAIRPNAKSLSVSQGKGLTRILASVSAVMESIELWHAEEAGLFCSRIEASREQLASQLPYHVEFLPQQPRSILSPGLKLHWVPASVWHQDEPTWVPLQALELDSTHPSAFSPPIFAANTNGLASGNTLHEALLHAMYELIERDAVVRARNRWEGRVLSLQSVAGPCRTLLNRFTEAAISVSVRDLGDISSVPCYEAHIWSPSVPQIFAGYGCHLDRNVALSRALTEAAQSRLTAIAGTRDDVPAGLYLTSSPTRIADPIKGYPTPSQLFDDELSNVTQTVEEDLEIVSACIEKRIGHPPVIVDLTRRGIDIPVARVFAPGLQFPEGH